MTITDAGQSTVEAQRDLCRTAELVMEDRPDCPACGAGPEDQATMARVPDGWLELAILVCTRCAQDHPAWF